MKKYFPIILKVIKDFLINPFWLNWPVLVIVGVSIGLNGLLWYLFKTRVQTGILPMLFATGLVILNLVLANFLFNREKPASLMLISVGLFVQILMLVFIRYLMMVF